MKLWKKVRLQSLYAAQLSARVGTLMLVTGAAFAVDPTIADITAVVVMGTLIAAVVALGISFAGFKLVKQGAIVILTFLGKLR